MVMKDKFQMTVDENIFLAKKILVGTVYNSAKLEGVNATFPETEAILDGINVAGVGLDDIQVITSLRDAWRDLLIGVRTAKINLKLLEKINSNVARNQSLEWGKLRTGKIGIAGTNHKPTVPERKEVVAKIAQIMAGRQSATEKAIDLMLYVMSAQLFWDGNKRTASLAASAILIQNGAGILSIAESDIVEFNRLLSEFYDTGEPTKLKKFLYMNAVIDFDSMKVAQNVHANVPENVHENIPLNPTELAVLGQISQNPHQSFEEIAVKIRKTPKTVQRAVAELKQREIITRVGSDKTGYWQIHKS
jgi:prophage maintenance system killer protein/DNA-binding CsgD family transcriptional regulator